MKSHCCKIDDSTDSQRLTHQRQNVTKSKLQHPCCDIKEQGASICPECRNTGKPVMDITLKSIVKEPILETIDSLDGFNYCETPACEVVYFNNEQQVYLHKQEVKVRVGIKETENPVLVCYCFRWTQERIFNQIRQLGYSTAVQEISAQEMASAAAVTLSIPKVVRR